jgi:hypothetical protein
VGNPVVTVLRMAAMITIQVIPHVQQLLGDHDLQSLGTGDVDTVQIDENGMDA